MELFRHHGNKARGAGKGLYRAQPQTKVTETTDVKAPDTKGITVYVTRTGKNITETVAGH